MAMLVGTITDKNYLPWAGSFLRSLSKNGSLADADVIVGGIELSADDQDKLRTCIPSHELSFLDIPPEQEQALRSMKTNVNWPTATWIRVMFPSLLPVKDGRFVLFDSDISIMNSLRPLFEMDMRGHAIAAVPAAKPREYIEETNRRLQLPLSRPYFNAGVMMVDIARWREEDLTRRVMEYGQRHAERLKFLDQDAINAVLGESGRDFLELDRTWNNYLMDDSWQRANVIHFVYDKPIFRESTHPARHVFRQHLAETPWGGRRLPSRRSVLRKQRFRRVAGLLKKLFGTWRRMPGDVRPGSPAETPAVAPKRT